VIYPAVADHDNGVYSVAYTPALRGVHDVTIEVPRRRADAAAGDLPGGLTGRYYNDRCVRRRGWPAVCTCLSV
jgi:hypothetical protein